MTPVTLADVLAREAGAPHVWIAEGVSPAEAAMALGDLYGIHVEPVIEADASLCARQVPIWHAGADWSYCAQALELAEDPKRPTLPPETWALLGATAMGAAWVYPGASAVYGGSGGGWWPASVYGGDGAETVETTTIRECCGGGCLWCPTPTDEPEPPEPAPVPLPGSAWLLAGALGLLRSVRRAIAKPFPIKEFSAMSPPCHPNAKGCTCNPDLNLDSDGVPFNHPVPDRACPLHGRRGMSARLLGAALGMLRWRTR